ncbi:Hypothetical predicted protein [Olea europaea subsp. europaea]|uniref:Stress-induced protein KIN2-like n=1 Tax=Olea europaea subsp. europaea TaxID=158383 RepID=A0A8S0Q2Q3_OLEEU|nr:Hypothetical predicted protein [Olea europaea subsp. europaea]
MVSLLSRGVSSEFAFIHTRKLKYLKSKEKSSQVMDKISNTAQSAKDSMQEAGQQMKAKAQGAADAVKDSVNK